MKFRVAVRRSIGIILLMVTSLSVSATAQPATLSSDSCKAFVKQFYDWYVPVNAKEGGKDPYALKQKGSVFSPNLLQKLNGDLAASRANKGEIVGLDFDPFLNTQDPSPHFVVQDAVVKGNTCLATVRGVDSGKMQEYVQPELSFGGDAHWRFVNFHYEESRAKADQDLLSILDGLAKDRQKMLRK